MKNHEYGMEEIRGLLPLLASIGREIDERSQQLESVLSKLESLGTKDSDKSHARPLIAEAANHRRELRHAREELSRLGCSVVGTTPLTFCIPGKEGPNSRSVVWQTGDPVLK